ncbi:MAG TPA: hypothetical protein VMT98_03355 [Verrucomicrobiae bacterium]|jgi:hypothetical protein|nr:hypothetical protein [Verrucomicrobiae bacterium]
MDALTPAFVVGVILISLLASVAIWAPRRIWVRCWAVALSAVVFVSGYAALTDMLSRPKPMSLAWAEGQIEAADVLGSTFIEGEAIYVWLRLPGSMEPRSYKLPWDQRRAQELQDAMNEAGQLGTGVEMRQPFDDYPQDEEPMFYALPQTPTPEKNFSAGQKPVIYERPGADSNSL